MAIPREQLRLTDEELAELLRDTRTMRVGTLSPDGWPHVVPLWFVWHAGAIWINNLRESRRTRDLEAGSKAALCIDTGHDYFELRGAVLYGTPAEAGDDIAVLLPNIRGNVEGADLFARLDDIFQ